MPWTKERTDNFIRFVGIVELLGALGAVLPMLTHILPWLTPLAAIGLSILQGFAIFTDHLPKKEYKFLPLNLYFMAMSIFVLIGRWSLLISAGNTGITLYWDFLFPIFMIVWYMLYRRQQKGQ